MKKIFSFLSIAALALSIVGCGPDEKPTPIDVNDITEDGFYVIGEATGLSEITAALTMANGINEANNQTAREGMYEKYIVLQADKEFTLAYVNGGKQTAYGATLTEFKPEELSGIYADNPADAVFKGALVVGDAAPKMKVSKTGLYHIVLDLNTAKDLSEAQIILCPVTMGVRGGMNNWGFTALEATAASNDGITFTLSGQELGNNGEFKFAYNSAWKITLDSEGAVKANTNLGKDCKPGGDNIVVSEGAGKYKITLTYKLAAGDIANSFKYTTEQESKAEYPAELYMTGTDFGGWTWGSDGIVKLQHISAGGDAKDGCFVTTRFIKKDNGVKFSSINIKDDWSKSFGGMTNNSDNAGFDGDGNLVVPNDGLWTITIDFTTDKLTLTEGMIYGMGDCFAGNWTAGKNPGAVNADGTANITAQNDGVLRVYAPCAFDWWQHEFRPTTDGKIEYREGAELEGGFEVKAGDTIIFDFNAGTSKVVSGTTPPSPGTTVTIKDFAQEYVKILDIWEATTGPVKMHSSVDATENAHYVPADTKITVGGKEYNTADMFETALRSYLLTRGYDGNELEKYGKNSIDKITAPKSISETEVPETHGYEWGDSPFNETSGNGGHLVMGTAEKNEHCKVKVDILDNWAMRSLNYKHGKPVTNLCGYTDGQLDGYYGCFCSQRALITYAFFFKYMLDNNIDLGANVGADVIIRSELFGDEGAVNTDVEPFKAEWLFTADAMSAYASTFGGTEGIKSTLEGDGGLYVDSNVSPNGRITYVQVDKAAVDPDNKASRIVGKTGHPYVTGPWTGDYWLFTLSNGKELGAGTKAHIKYITRVSKTGPKFWVAEYNDGEEWKPAFEIKNDGSTGLEYNVQMEADGSTNVTVEAEFTLAKAASKVQFRMRCVSMLQASGGAALEKCNGGTSRIAGAEGDSPIFEVL